MVDNTQAYQAAYRAAGYTGDFGGGAANAWRATQGKDVGTNIEKLKTQYSQGQNGVMPTTLASQNPYQQQALYDMGKAPAPLDPRISASYDKASQGYNPDSYKQFMNPYIDEVINRNASNITRQYDVQRNNINEDMAAAGGFGSSAQGVERALTNEAQNRQIGDMDATLRSAAYGDSVNNAMNLYSGDANRALNTAQGLQGFDSYGRQVTQNAQDRQLFAGDRVQAQNQAQLDAYFAERDKAQKYPYQQTDYLKSILGAYPTGQSQSGTEPMGGNPYQNAVAGYGIGTAFGDAFKDPFDVVPNNGSYGPQQPWTRF